MARIKYSDSFASFLQKKRDSSEVAKLLYYDYEWDRDRYTTDEHVNYITFRTDGTISYLPAGKEHKYNPDTYEWLRDGRQNGKPAKVIRKLFKKETLVELTDADFELFANNYKANYSVEGYTFELKSNKHIGDVYDMDRCNMGTLGDSCMNGDSEYMEMYEGCKDLKILTLQKDGQLYGRALVWKINDEITFMDRVYVAKDFLTEKFIEYGKAQGWWVKEHPHTYNYKTKLVKPDGTKINKVLRIELNTDYDYFPYMDTFAYGGKGFLQNDNEGCSYTYNNTNGSRDGDYEEDDHEDETYDETYDEIRDCYISDDDAVVISHGSSRYRDRTTRESDTVMTVDGNRYHENDDDVHFVRLRGRYYDHDSDDIHYIDGEYVHADDCVYVERDDEYKLIEDCVQTETGEYILKDEAVAVNGEWIHKDDVVEDDSADTTEVETKTTSPCMEFLSCDGEYVHADDCVYVERDDEYKLIEDCVQTETGEYILKDEAVAVNGEWIHKDDVVEDDSADTTEVETKTTSPCMEFLSCDGEYVHADDCVYVERDDEYKLIEDCVQTETGEYILKDEAVAVNGEWIHKDDVVEDDSADTTEVETKTTTINKIIDLNF